MDIPFDSMFHGAKSASQNAYAPYSRFTVGAAVLTSDGRIFSGCNVENASYGLSVCAERNAVFQAIAAGAKKIEALLIYTPTEAPTTPCGACRQVINEFGPSALIVATCDTPQQISLRLDELLPLAFGLATPKSEPKGS